MQECTPEIIIQSAKKAGLCVHQISPSNPAFLVSNPESRKSFVAAPWSIYPTVQNWHASIMRYKELSSHYLTHGGFNSIPGHFIDTAQMTQESLHTKLMEYISIIGFPCVIKPNMGSMSRNVYIIKDQKQLQSNISNIHSNIDHLLIQKYIKQDEYRVFIHNGQILYLYKKQFVLNDGMTDRLNESPCEKKYMMTSSFPTYLQDFAKKLYTHTNAEIMGVDIFLESNIETEQEITVIELNHNPGLGVMYETYNEKEFITEFLSGVYKKYLS